MQNDKADVKNSTRCHSKLIHPLSLSSYRQHTHIRLKNVTFINIMSHVEQQRQTTFTRTQVTSFPFHENDENTGFFATPQTNKHDNYIWQTTTVLPPTREVVIRRKRVASPVGCIRGGCREASRQETWTKDKIIYFCKTILLGLFGSVLVSYKHH